MPGIVLGSGNTTVKKMKKSQPLRSFQFNGVKQNPNEQDVFYLIVMSALERSESSRKVQG